jgi:hypothetical protein
MARDVEVIWVKSEPEYFYEEDWTTQIRLNPKENFFSVIPGRRILRFAIARRGMTAVELTSAVA